MLHIVNKSPFECSSLASCLRVAQDGAVVLLIEDAVYAASRSSEAALLRDSGKKVRFYALRPDIDARGMQERIAEGVECVDYAGFVDLVVSHESVQSWL